MTAVLVTGAGGAAVPGLIKSLRKYGYRVLAADMDRYAAGLYLADSGFVIPAGKSPGFLAALRSICLQEKVGVVVPLVDEELLVALELEKEGVAVLTPRREFVALCLDKFMLMERLSAAGISVPRTKLPVSGLDGAHFPMVIKPRRGRGSRGLGILQSKEDMQAYLESSAFSIDELIMQDYIPGREYTVSVVCWRDGEVQAVVPKEIIVKQGITRMAVTRCNSKIDVLCRCIQDALRADGPFNVQLRVDGRNGEPLPFEINPRFSTTISLTMAAGIDEMSGLIEQALNGRNGYRFNAWKEGVVLLRQTLDEFVEESAFLEASIMDFSKDFT